MERKLEIAVIAGLIGYERMVASEDKAVQDVLSDIKQIFTQTGLIAGRIAEKLGLSASVIAYGMHSGIFSESILNPEPASAEEHRLNALLMTISFYAVARVQTKLLLEKGFLMKGGISCGRPSLVTDADSALPIVHAIDIWRTYRLPLVVVNRRTYEEYLDSALNGGLVENKAGLESLFIQLDDGHMGLDYMRTQRFLADVLCKNGAREYISKPFFGYEEHRAGILLSVEKNKSLILSDPETKAMYRWLIRYHNQSANLLRQDCFIDESVLDPPAPGPIEPADKGLFSRLKRHRI